MGLAQKAFVGDSYLKSETYSRTEVYNKSEAVGTQGSEGVQSLGDRAASTGSSSDSGGPSLGLIIGIVIAVVIIDNVIIYLLVRRNDKAGRGPNLKRAGSSQGGSTHVVKNPLYTGNAKKKDEALAKTLSRTTDNTYDYTSAGAWKTGADQGYMAIGDSTYSGIGVENPLFSSENKTDMYMSVGQVSDENERMKAEIAAMQQEMNNIQSGADPNDADDMYAMMPNTDMEDSYAGIAPYNEDDDLEDAYM